MHFVYIIQSQQDRSYYTGQTHDPESRLTKHNNGEVTYTSKKRPWKLIWYGAFLEEQKAIEFEKYLKIGSGFAFARKHLV